MRQPLPETILQFGSGRFLRAFADLFIHQANERGQAVGRVVIVQSTGGARANTLSDQNGAYHVVIRGFENGEVVDRVERCASVSRAIAAKEDWASVLELAKSPELKFVLSNTTEAGYALTESDGPNDSPPNSFPAKLTQLLYTRFEAGLPPLTLIPCELMEGNAAILRDAVVKLARDWHYPVPAIQWIESECVWLKTLVDRIVSGTPKEHPLLASDPMLIVAEPYALFAIETHPKAFPFAEHPAIVRTGNVEPYFLRKVRILNAAHTALLIKAVPRGFKLVREAIRDPELSAWLRALLFEEIVPTLEGRVVEPARFAEQTIDRFLNPFLDHQFADIALHHESKLKIRLVTTRAEYEQRFGKAPERLTAVIAEGFTQLR